MKIAIIGCGWVGFRLAKYLTGKNHHVVATTTSAEKIPLLEGISTEVHLLDFAATRDFSFLDEVEMTVFSMPISRETWLEGFKNLDQKLKKSLLFSSTGIYPTENKTFTEKDTQNLRPDILRAENTVLEQYPQTTVLRFGGLMGDERSLQNIFKNRAPENPEKKANYIHYEDILNIVDLLLTSDRSGEIYNVVAPEHPSIAEILSRENEDGFLQFDGKKHRIISSEHLVQNLNYTFIHPNPKYF